jgi:hypothetical protein
MAEYSVSIHDPQEPLLLSEFDVVTPEDEARAFLRQHNRPSTIDIRYGICTDYEVGIYDAKTAFFHLVDHGGLDTPEELMRVVCAGVRALSSQEGDHT